MKLTPKEIEEQKKLHGAEAVNFFVRFMEARERWRRLPDYFIKEVISNSDDIRTNKNLRGGNNRTNKRKDYLHFNYVSKKKNKQSPQ